MILAAGAALTRWRSPGSGEQKGETRTMMYYVSFRIIYKTVADYHEIGKAFRCETREESVRLLSHLGNAYNQLLNLGIISDYRGEIVEREG